MFAAGESFEDKPGHRGAKAAANRSERAGEVLGHLPYTIDSINAAAG